MDIGKAFSFVFEDAQWVTKLLIAAAILLVGMLFSWVLGIPMILASLLLGGYMVAIIRRVLRGQLDGLPEWTDWGGLLTDGLKFFVVGLVYALPIILLSLCLGLPAGLLAEESPELGSLLSVLLSCLSILWAIVMSIVLPAAVAFWVANDDLGAAFRFGEVLGFVRQNLSTYLVTFIMSWVASLIGGLGSVVCGIGILATFPYSYMVMGHMYGQAYMAGSGQVQAPDYEEFA